ncbi:MAG: hypothetical protein A2Y15_03350 [Clostridiales bacterium GWF2_36_10]|nr:MAG: hypothetical protein A2Y15_03350 [Clostridiales bacterium GWF2_36_10]HAN20146.1 heavy metal transporter [Clostridiales bacterium]
MKKVIKIDGMSCGHCKARVEKVLGDIDGVSAKVNLEKGEAIVSIDKDVADNVLTSAVTEAGYTVVSINEKKGLFEK